MSFGADLRKARIRRGLSQRNLSKLIAKAFEDVGTTLSPKGIQYLETGRSRFPRETTVSLLAEVLPELSQYIQE
jgi:transcriptional regulator with XRE-family HTH domain